MIGAVYYHLLLCVILILWGFHPRKPLKPGLFLSLGVVVVSSIWAGISRVNWFPVPGIIASTIYFLETNKNGTNLFRYSLKGLSWSLLGGLVALTTYGIYIMNSGNPPIEFTSSFTAKLLWNRLLPNPTFKWGILPSILFVTLPLVVIIIIKLTSKRVYYAPSRLILLAGLSCILLLGGLVASVKIGGGSNLHNLDAYMIIILIITSYLYYEKMAPDRSNRPILNNHADNQRFIFHSFGSQIISGFTLIMPIVFVLITVGPTKIPSGETINSSLKTIQKYASTANKEGGNILFISERQLLTFHRINDIPMIPEYEKFFLMEMAMAGNNQYMGKFYDDIQNHRFILIVTEPVITTIHKDLEGFGDENQIWRKYVNKALFCYYKPIETLNRIGVVILRPRTKDKCVWPKN
jgi:hypothetical protein